jgi:hypothetical protein
VALASWRSICEVAPSEWSTLRWGRVTPVAPARRSHAAAAKASYQHDESGHPYRSFRGLLDHLATTRNGLRVTGTDPTVPILAEPTADQRHAFELIGTTIPLTLK